MKLTTIPGRLYLTVSYLAGIAVLVSRIDESEINQPLFLAILCVLGSLALLLKVEGNTQRPYYTFSLVIYGFTLISLGINDTIMVMLVSHLVEWIWYRPSGSRQLFNISVSLVAIEAAGMVYFATRQGISMAMWSDTLAILVGMAAFVAVTHLMMGIQVWSTRKACLKTSGVFDTFTLVLDGSLLCFGASLAIIWKYDPYTIVLFMIPAYLLYRALRIPALERKTEIDSKTGLFNHAYFKKELERELARSKRLNHPLSVIIADLDLLRNINNTYGHLAGDEVLIGVAKAMKNSVRNYDVVSRFGGEEFAILLPETTLVQAYEKAEFFRKMIESMEFIVPTTTTPIRATMSFGVAHYENYLQSSIEIVHNADLALYKSKLGGRNRTFAHNNNTCIDFPTGGTGTHENTMRIGVSDSNTIFVENDMRPPFQFPR